MNCNTCIHLYKQLAQLKYKTDHITPKTFLVLSFENHISPIQKLPQAKTDSCVV